MHLTINLPTQLRTNLLSYAPTHVLGGGGGAGLVTARTHTPLTWAAPFGFRSFGSGSWALPKKRGSKTDLYLLWLIFLELECRMYSKQSVAQYL